MGKNKDQRNSQLRSLFPKVLGLSNNLPLLSGLESELGSRAKNQFLDKYRLLLMACLRGTRR